MFYQPHFQMLRPTTPRPPILFDQSLSVVFNSQALESVSYNERSSPAFEKLGPGLESRREFKHPIYQLATEEKRT